MQALNVKRSIQDNEGCIGSLKEAFCPNPCSTDQIVKIRQYIPDLRANFEENHNDGCQDVCDSEENIVLPNGDRPNRVELNRNLSVMLYIYDINCTGSFKENFYRYRSDMFRYFAERREKIREDDCQDVCDSEENIVLPVSDRPDRVEINRNDDCQDVCDSKENIVLPNGDRPDKVDLNHKDDCQDVCDSEENIVLTNGDRPDRVEINCSFIQSLMEDLCNIEFECSMEGKGCIRSSKKKFPTNPLTDTMSLSKKWKRWTVAIAASTATTAPAATAAAPAATTAPAATAAVTPAAASAATETTIAAPEATAAVAPAGTTAPAATPKVTPAAASAATTAPAAAPAATTAPAATPAVTPAAAPAATTAPAATPAVTPAAASAATETTTAAPEATAAVAPAGTAAVALAPTGTTAQAPAPALTNEVRKFGLLAGMMVIMMKAGINWLQRFNQSSTSTKTLLLLQLLICISGNASSHHYPISQCIGSTLVLNPNNIARGEEFYLADVTRTSASRGLVIVWFNSRITRTKSDRVKYLHHKSCHDLLFEITDLNTSDAGWYRMDVVLTRDNLYKTHKFLLEINDCDTKKPTTVPGIEEDKKQQLPESGNNKNQLVKRDDDVKIEVGIKTPGDKLGEIYNIGNKLEVTTNILLLIVGPLVII